MASAWFAATVALGRLTVPPELERLGLRTCIDVDMGILRGFSKLMDIR